MTTCDGTRSASAGSAGAAMTSRPLSSCVVTTDCTPWSSRCPLMATRSRTEPCGWSCRLIATSPNIRSRSTRSVLAPVGGEVGGEVGRHRRLADATLGAEDRDDLARRGHPRWCRGRSAAAVRAIDRRTASASAVWSSAWTTSRTPLRRAWASAVTSRRCRSRMTPSSGRSMRSRSASSHAESRSMSGPMTTSDWLRSSSRARLTRGAGVEAAGRRRRARSGRCRRRPGSQSQRIVMVPPPLS